MNDLTLTVSKRIAAPPARVFEAWLDPEMLAKFMTPGRDMTVPRAATDPVEGGRFDIAMKTANAEIPHSGTYREITRHSRLVFTWESPFSAPGSTVTLDFEEVEGGTQVTLKHVKFTSEERRDNHAGGWTSILDQLAGQF